MRILCDMDGVLANCMKHWLTLLNRYHNLNLTIDDITDWDIARFSGGLPADTVYGYLREPGFFRHLEPIPGAREAIKYLMDLGHEVVIVTACRYGHVDKRAWLKAHMPFFNQSNLIFAERKEFVSGDVLIDDGLHNLKAWKLQHPDGEAICFAQPYNIGYQGERSDRWEQIVRTLVSLESELAEAGKLYHQSAMAVQGGQAHGA